MQKSRKNVEPVATQNNANRANQRYTQPQRPPVVDMDTIGNMSDEELASELHTVETGRENAYNTFCDTRPWEVEVAYFKREQHVRRLRREAHEKWMMHSRQTGNYFDNAATVSDAN